MRAWPCVLLLALLPGTPVSGQGVTPFGPLPAPTWTSGDYGGPSPWLAPAPDAGEGRFASNRKFPNFIGWMSDPFENIDPRSLTQIQPIFGSFWLNTTQALPDANFQLYGPPISVALTDRLCVGVNQGGYAVIHGDRADPRGPLRDRLARTRGQEFGGTREGFLNVGAFAQYTLIEDAESQFLLTGGLRVIAPCGAREVFQGFGPAQLAPYLTFGKELGQFHVLGTLGYQFPVGGGADHINAFNFNVHLDRQCFGWLYPLVELNTIYHTEAVDFDLPTRRGFADFGNFASSGNIVTLAAGANAVLVRDRLELGAVYTTVLASQRNFDLNGLLVKLTLRF